MQISIVHPEARVIEQPGAVWVASGLSRSDAATLARHPGSATAERLCRRVGDASIIRLDRGEGPSGALTAWKGITSCHEVFYRISTDGYPIVTDHFRNALASVPESERQPCADALCDHFLFRTIPAGKTLCATIQRLGRGERLDADLHTGTTRRTVFQRVEPAARPGKINDYLDRLDAALGDTLLPWRGHETTVNCFSGGIDSTLVQTYLSNDVNAACYELPHYADGFEANYAGQAADLMGLRLQRRRADVDGYLAQLERLIADTGMPPPHPQLAFYQCLFDGHGRHYLVGEQADALFGIGLRNIRLAAPFRSRPGLATLRAAHSLTGGRRRHRFARLQHIAHRLAQPPYSLDGYAAQFGVYTDHGMAQRVFGSERIRDRVQARFESLLARLQPSAPRGQSILHHVEAAHMMGFLGEDTMMCFRHLAHARGNTVASPFMSGALLNASLSIPVQHRYFRGLTGKYLPKLLLARRLPEYPINQPKGYSHVPFDDLYRRSSLRHVWERYAVPEPFDGADRETLVKHPTQITWNAVTLAIWQAQLRSPMTSVTGTRTLTPAASAAPQPGRL